MPIAPSHVRDTEELPDEIYISLVESLFRDPKNLILGSLSTIGAAVITGIKAGDILFYLCALALTAIALGRALDMRAFKRREDSKPLDLADARRWEVRYVLGSSVYVFAMGVWCFLAFARTADPMVQLLCVSLVLVNVIGVMGRNFGSKLLVTAQLLCSGLPLLAALLWTGDLFYLLAAGVLTPFFFAFSTIADRLRQTLMGAVVAERDVRLLANRLDAALNNMSHGLCMVDRKGTIAISNNRLPHLLGVQPDVFRPGRPAIEAFLSCVRAGVVAPADLRRILAEIRSRLGEGAASLILPIRGRRTLMITSRSMPDGSSVMLAEDVTEQKKAEAQIRHLAHYDYLTDLPNRVKFRESVGRLLEEVTPESGCAVLFVDLDEFKQVNDTLGHPAGDVLLQLVATRLRTLAAESQLIARLGGDEFVIVIAPTARPEQAGAVAQRVVDELSRPFRVDGHAIIIGASVGIAIAPTDGTDADTLLKNADMALYRAKAEGRGRYRFFEPEMDTRMRERRALEIDLREAVAGAALELHYQPLVNLQTGRIAACEALLRWHHPERGLVSPGEFIPLAEEMGLIVEIGRWVLFSACCEATHWPADTRVSVNLSPSQFRQPGLVETVGEALDRSGLDPARLDLEITESTLLRDTDGVLQTLEQIRALGVSISLDDFGTGYSSLSYLRKFPLQTVKIDRSFLLGIEANDKQRVLLRGIARLCGELGVRVVIEGVETSAQLDIISANPEIEEAQGFLFAKPASAAHTRRLLGFGFNSVTSASAAYGPTPSRRSAR